MNRLQHLSYKTLFTILFFSLAGIVFFLKIGGKTTKVSAAWWDDMWHYRKAVTITENTGTNVNNLPIKLSINGLSNKAQSDCDDIRITDINGNIVNSQIETCDIDNISIIWIQDNIVANIQKTYYIYYGNPTAPAPSYNQNDTSLSVEVNGTSFQIKNSFVDLRGNTTNPSGAIRNLIDVPTELDTAQIDGSNFRIDYHYESALGGDAAATSTPTIIKDGPVFKQIGWTEAATSFSVNRNVLIFNNFPITFQRYQITNNSASSYTFNSGHHSMTESGRCYNFSGDSRCSASAGDSVGGDSSHGWFIDNTDNIGMCKIRSNNSTTSAGWRSYGSPSPTLTLNSGETSGWYEYYLSTITSGSQCDNYANIMYTQKIASLESPEESGGGPIAYWKFDEGTGATAYDSAGSNNGTFGTGSSAPTWANESQCISGKCLSFDGTQSVNSNYDASWNNTNKISINFWVKPQNITDIQTGIIGKQHSLYEWSFYQNGNSVSLVYWDTSGSHTNGMDDSWGSVLIANKWTNLAYTWDGSTSKFYADGKLVKTKTATNPSINMNRTNNMMFGGNIYTWGDKYFKGSIDEVKIYPYARTADQIKQDYNSRGTLSGSSANLGIQSNTAPSLKSSLVAYYKFDENNGTTVYDSINSATGTVYNGATWMRTNLGIGLSLGGYGSNDYISLSNQPLNNATVWSISTKLKYINLAATFEFFLGQNDLTTGKILLRHNGYISFRGTNGTYYDFPTTSAEINNLDSNLLFVSNGTTIKLYINGIYKSSITPGSTSISIDTIGNAWTDTVWTSAFVINELKIYNRALTADEVKQDYNQGSAISFGTTTQNIGGTTTSLDYCIPGDTSYCAPPIAEWKMDEGTGTSIVDTSGNNNTGTLGAGNSAPTWTQGKIGKGMSFNGTNQFIDLSSNTNLQIGTTNSWTYEAWVNVKGTGNQWDSTIFGTGGNGWRLGCALDGSIGTTANDHFYPRIECQSGISGEIFTASSSTNILNQGWVHITGILDRTIVENESMSIYINGKLISKNTSTPNWIKNFNLTSNKFTIGKSPNFTNRNFNGNIDQIKIYNYARTPAQIAYDYNKGGPVGWWKFDECQGNIAYDWSGIGNTGTITIGASGTQNSLGTCAVGTSAAWTNGASGHINSSLNLDGTDDYVDAGTNPSLNFGTTDYSISLWAKRNNLTGTQILVDKRASEYVGFVVFFSGTNLYLRGNGSGHDVSLTSAITDTRWHQITITNYRKGEKAIFIDGIKRQSIIYDSSSLDINSNYSLKFSKEYSQSNYFFNGQIDDVRIYNYALTSEQVKQIYNGGSVSFN